MSDLRLTRLEIAARLADWIAAWNRHDLDGVMALFHEDVVFEHWTGARVVGKTALRRAWRDWFAGADFHFITEETFIDDAEQKAVFRWRLHWPSRERPFTDQPEERQGLDVLHFHDGLITRKLTYSKTAVTIAGRSIPLTPD